MKDYSQHQHVASMERSAIEGSSSFQTANMQASSGLQSVTGDDRYPGTFFRIPGIPAPGKTTWSLVK